MKLFLNGLQFLHHNGKPNFQHGTDFSLTYLGCMPTSCKVLLSDSLLNSIYLVLVPELEISIITMLSKQATFSLNLVPETRRIDTEAHTHCVTPITNISKTYIRLVVYRKDFTFNRERIKMRN